MFFLASMGISQAHEQAVMNYWWVRPEGAPAHASRVVRVLGEKGEHSEEVYTLDRQARLENSPVVMQARLERQEMLRREAMALVKKLKAEGKSPVVAYEEAWTRVYKNHWLTANWQLGSSKLEDMLLRMSAENQSELTAEEQQWVLEALLENDDRLETKAGRELLRRLTQRLRALGYGKFYSPNAANDQVMKRFADALSTGMDSMAAYREAMFTTHRNRVGQHSLRGYVAPWGIRVGGPRYHQAPLKVGTTAGSASGLDAALAANPQPGNQLTAPGLNDVSAAEKDFLAVSPEDEKKEKNEQEDELVKQEGTTTSSSASAMAAAPAPMMRSFSLRAAAPYAAGDDVAAIADPAADLKVNGTAVLYFNNRDGLTTTNKTQVKGSNKNSNSRTYSISTYGSYDGTVKWQDTNWRTSSSGTLDFWRGNANKDLSQPGKNATVTDSSTNAVNKKLNIIEINDNDKLYMGGYDYAGTLRVVTDTPNAYLGSYLPQNVVYDFGKLTGSGTLTLLAHGTERQASVYSFDDTATGVTWFSGTMQFGASQKGIVQLDLGSEGATEAWENVEFNLDAGKGPGHATTTGADATRIILNIRDRVTIAGLSGGDAKSTVTAESTTSSFTLTLGDEYGQDYNYGGTFKGTFYNDSGVEHTSPAGLNITKVGANTQTFSGLIDRNSALHNVTVTNGTLEFAQNAHVNRIWMSGGKLLAEDSLTVLGSKAVEYVDELPRENEEVHITGGLLEVKEKLTVTDDILLYGSGTLNAGSLEVGSNMRIFRKESTDAPMVTVSGATDVVGHVRVDSGSFTTGSLSVNSDLRIGTDAGVDVNAVVQTGELTAGSLRLQSDGHLITTGSVSLGVGAAASENVLHMGSSWTMSGDSNRMETTLNIRSHGDNASLITLTGVVANDQVATAAGSVVLTMPGTIDFRDTETGNSFWNDPESAIFSLNGVTLDFASNLPVTFRNMGFALGEGTKITLAECVDGNGWYKTDYTSVVLQGAGQRFHGELSKSEDGKYIYITVMHAMETPYTIKSGGEGGEFESSASGVVYAEMSPWEVNRALPVLAYDAATYSSVSGGYAAAGNGWSGTKLDSSNMLALNNISLGKGGKLYLGESATESSGVDYRGNRRFDSNIEVAADNAELHAQVGTWGVWQLGGLLSGKGNLTLVSHNAPGAGKTVASVFSFTQAVTPENWLNGTLRLADPTGGAVQLNVGNVDIAKQGDTRWNGVVIDLTRKEFTDTVTGQRGTTKEIVLAVQGDATVSGLLGDSTSRVVSDLPVSSNKAAPTLTLGDNSGNEYTFGGTVGAGGAFYQGGECSGEQLEGSYREYNYYSTREKSLNLTKVGDNTQIFTGKVFAEQVEVQGGTLALAAGDIDRLVVSAGGTVRTSAAVGTGDSNLTLGSITLYGGATWELGVNTSFSGDLVSLMEMENSSVTLTSSSNDRRTWTSMTQLDLAGAGDVLNNTSALFTLDSSVVLTLSPTLNITNLYTGENELLQSGSSIALYQLNGQTVSLTGSSVLVMDTNGQYYNASYSNENGLVSIIIGDARDFGIVVKPDAPSDSPASAYYWSGVATNGTTINDTDHLGLTLGNVWRADGSAENTGWHEQRLESVSPGTYVNGTKVVFSDSSVVHTDSSDNFDPHRHVYVLGKVAPGEMIVNAENDSGKIGKGDAEMRYGYLFQAADGAAGSRISDVSDTQRTSITKSGGSALILHMPNDFTGGIDLQDGVLYFTRPGAGGYGPITMHTDATWTDYWDKSSGGSGFVEVSRTGVELMVNYQHSGDVASAYRNPRVQNTILLQGTPGSHATISYARASVDDMGSDFSNVPRHWRNLNLTGGVFGTGDLVLRGYSSTYANTNDQSYVAAFSINKTQLNETLIQELIKAGKVNAENYTAFTGEVRLENTVNHSWLSDNEVADRTASTMQLTLVDDVFAKGRINLTREYITQDMVNASGGDLPEAGRQSYASILVVNGDVSVGALTADFHGAGYHTKGTTSTSGWRPTYTHPSADKELNTQLSNDQERWRVRTVTGSQTTLHLGLEDAETYVYSGTMGFAQSYTQPQEAHIAIQDFTGLTPYSKLDNSTNAYDGFSNVKSFSSGVEQLSVVKRGSSKQYIHSAVLDDVELYGGLLGFNNLDLKGNLDMSGGTTLHLGATGNLDSNDAKQFSWDKITETVVNDVKSGVTTISDYITTETATLNSGKTLTVHTMADAQGAWKTAQIQGNVTLDKGAALTLLGRDITPDSLPLTTVTQGHESEIVPLLNLTGTLTLQKDTVINLNFDNANFSSGQKYYLVGADSIVIGDVWNSDETDFVNRMVTLGYGYFGKLYTVGNVGSSNGDGDKANRDYLVMTVSGDPRHTWHGKTTNYDWSAKNFDNKSDFVAYRNTVVDESSTTYDYRWKENTEFVNGHVVLFGNLYTPTEWTENNRLTSDESVQVLVKDNGASIAPQSGVLLKDILTEADLNNPNRTKFNIDGVSIEDKNFQAVKVTSRVAPFIVMINSSYEAETRTGGEITSSVNTADGTNYYFFTGKGYEGGYIDDARDYELEAAGFDTSWKTQLHKTGEGTLVMALDNRYTGGTILQGGITVMQHVNALGYVWDASKEGRAGEGNDDAFTPYDATITLMDGAALHGNFNDVNFTGNYTGGHVSMGGFMFTTTINNKLVVNKYTDPGATGTPESGSASSVPDGIVINSWNKKLILNELVGEKNVELHLHGVGRNWTEADKQDADYGKYRYGVFKVIDPSHFYGTVSMSGENWGEGSESRGRVQLDIMSTAKSAEGADWLNATIDMTVGASTERTVLGLDVTSSGETCVVDSINGSVFAVDSETGKLINVGTSSVLNLSNHFAATLELEGMRDGHYDGVFGYGDFQVAVNYGGYTDEQQGSTQHHYGAEGHGTLDVIKKGNASTQSVRRAWLDDVIVEGGAFQVDNALVARNIEVGGTTRVFVGEVDTYTLYSLAVGKGGVLAMNTGMQETGGKTDAWAGVEAGTDLGAAEGEAVGPGTAYVRLESGAVLSAREDWFTARQVDIYNGAEVTINAHNFTIDPYVLTDSCTDPHFVEKRDLSHIVQLLGKVTGSDVTLNVNNWMLNPNHNTWVQNPENQEWTLDSRLWMDAEAQDKYVKHIGYVALNDLNDFGGQSKVNVEAMTVLQILQGNDNAMADVDITVEGKHATLQIVGNEVEYVFNSKTGLYDPVKRTGMSQYIDKLVLGHNTIAPGEDPNTTDPLHRANNGQLMLGGTEIRELKPEDTYLTEPKVNQIQVLVSSRHNTNDPDIKATIEGMHVAMTSASVKMGGTTDATCTIENAHIDMRDFAYAHQIHHTELSNSLVHLQEDCSVNIADMVLIKSDSAIRGAKIEYSTDTLKVLGHTVDPGKENPAPAVGSNPNRETVEVSTSVNTTVQLTFAGSEVYTVGNSTVLVLLVDQFQGVDVDGSGITLQLTQDLDSFLQMGFDVDADFIALQIGGGSGRFGFETTRGEDFSKYIDSQYVLQEADGSQVTGYWVTSQAVATASGVANVSMHMLYFTVPEPTTATLSLAALVALMGRRRRKD